MGKWDRYGMDCGQMLRGPAAKAGPNQRRTAPILWSVWVLGIDNRPAWCNRKTTTQKNRVCWGNSQYTTDTTASHQQVENKCPPTTDHDKKSFIYSLTDYLLYLQPLTQILMESSARLESRCLQYILRIPLKPNQAPRASLLTGMLPLRARRQQHLAKAVFNFLQIHNYPVRNGVAGEELRDNLKLWNNCAGIKKP